MFRTLLRGQFKSFCSESANVMSSVSPSRHTVAVMTSPTWRLARSTSLTCRMGWPSMAVMISPT